MWVDIKFHKLELCQTRPNSDVEVQRDKDLVGIQVGQDEVREHEDIPFTVLSANLGERGHLEEGINLGSVAVDLGHVPRLFAPAPQSESVCR